jgi:thiamine pyrophosphokinase
MDNADNTACGKCIIIAAGDLTVSEIRVNENDLIIATDGGIGYCGVLNVEPDMIIGDFDSLSDGERQAVENLKKEIPERIISLPAEKDDTDTLAAIKHGFENGYSDFRIYAATGGARLDHTLANIQSLLYIKNRGGTGYLCDGNGLILVIKDETIEFKENMQGRLSLFSMGEKATGVTVKGMKYTLDGFTMTNDFPIGISNEFIGEAASVTVENGEVLCMISY